MTAVTLTTEGNLARIRLDDGRGNALGSATLTALRDAFRDAAGADAVLLTGRPRVFCGGLDLAEVVPLSRPQLVDFLGLFHDVFRTLIAFERPVVIAAAGSAVAGGAILLCCGDYRLGAQDSGVIGVNEAQLGIPFPVTALEAVRLALDPAQAARALLLGELADKPEALRRGFLHELVDPATLEDAALGKACALARIPATASSLIKRDLRRDALRRIDEQRLASNELFAEIWTGPAAQERLRKVLEGLKRK